MKPDFLRGPYLSAEITGDVGGGFTGEQIEQLVDLLSNKKTHPIGGVDFIVDDGDIYTRDFIEQDKVGTIKKAAQNGFITTTEDVRLWRPFLENEYYYDIFSILKKGIDPQTIDIGYDTESLCQNIQACLPYHNIKKEDNGKFTERSQGLIKEVTQCIEILFKHGINNYEHVTKFVRKMPEPNKLDEILTYLQEECDLEAQELHLCYDISHHAERGYFDRLKIVRDILAKNNLDIREYVIALSGKYSMLSEPYPQNIGILIKDAHIIDPKLLNDQGLMRCLPANLSCAIKYGVTKFEDLKKIKESLKLPEEEFAKLMKEKKALLGLESITTIPVEE